MSLKPRRQEGWASSPRDAAILSAQVLEDEPNTSSTKIKIRCARMIAYAILDVADAIREHKS